MLFSIALGACQGRIDSGVEVSTIAFDPDTAEMDGSVCRTQAQLTSISSESSVLSVMNVQLQDEEGETATYTFDQDALEAAAGTLVVPSRSALEISIEIDLAEQGLSAPAEGDVLIVATTVEGTSQFVGHLRCGS
jgi:hypothetical protein